MANLQVKNVPEALHRKIRLLAEREGKTVRDVVLEAVDRAVTRAAWHERHRRRARVSLAEPAGRSVEEVRSQREHELGGTK
jgi:plasmid stability protein